MQKIAIEPQRWTILMTLRATTEEYIWHLMPLSTLYAICRKRQADFKVDSTPTVHMQAAQNLVVMKLSLLFEQAQVVSMCTLPTGLTSRKSLR
jgi:hypothetical protein